mgnify:CR=1 FL=1
MHREAPCFFTSILIAVVISFAACDNSNYGYTAIDADYTLIAATFDADRQLLSCDIHISISETA